MQLKSCTHALRRRFRRSKEGVHKPPGLHLIEFQGVMPTNDLLRRHFDMGHYKYRDRAALQISGTL